MTRYQRGDAMLAGALARGATQAAAGLEAGLSERTVRRRLDDPLFLRMLAREQMEVARQGHAQLAGLAPKAVETIADLMENGSPQVRLRAAQEVLQGARNQGQQADVDALRARWAAMDPL